MERFISKKNSHHMDNYLSYEIIDRALTYDWHCVDPPHHEQMYNRHRIYIHPFPRNTCRVQFCIWNCSLTTKQFSLCRFQSLDRRESWKTPYYAIGAYPKEKKQFPLFALHRTYKGANVSFQVHLFIIAKHQFKHEFMSIGFSLSMVNR